MIDERHPLLLGSGSPRRREILATLGLPFRVVSVATDEAMLAGERADAYLARVTLGKLAAVSLAPEARSAGAVLVADTIVLLDGAVLGKPADVSEAERMVRALSGRYHEVWTRFAVAGPGDPGAVLHAETVRTRVAFRDLGDDEIADYASTGEGLDKAGAYAVQGIGAFAVSRIEGSYHNVVGLPACEVVLALRGVGLLSRFPYSLPRAE